VYADVQLWTYSSVLWIAKASNGSRLMLARGQVLVRLHPLK
jgi:hypothetical protein